MRLILLGCPGAGKGTQAQFINQHFNIPTISTGEILRKAISEKSSLGLKVQEIVDAGLLVPDEIMIQLIRNRIHEDDCKNGFLLDGFPRTVAQARALHEQTSIDAILDIEVPEEEIINRLTGRRIHPESGRIYHIITNPPKIPDRDDLTGDLLIQRNDDKEETIRKRLMIYNEQTYPLKSYYQVLSQEKHKPIYVRINGVQSVNDIKTEIFDFLKTLQ